MDVGRVGEGFDGIVLRSCYEVFEKLVVWILGRIGKVSVVEDAEEYLKIEVEVEGERVLAWIIVKGKYSGFRVKEEVWLRIEEFVKKFEKKRFRVSQKNRFCELICEENVRKLYFILKRGFGNQDTLFGLLTKGLFIWILGFLDSRSLINVSFWSFEFNRFLSCNNVWQKLYCIRNPNQKVYNTELNWKEVFLTPPKLNHVKEIYTEISLKNTSSNK